MKTGAADKQAVLDYFNENYLPFFEKYFVGIRNGNEFEYTALCRFHEDSKPSFGFNAMTGQCLCHACGFKGDIFTVYGKVNGIEGDFQAVLRGIASEFGIISTGRLQAASKPIITKIYDYHDETGKLLFQTVRYDPKNFKQRQPDGKGGWIWNLNGIELVLYHLPEIIKAAEVFIVEGEKDVESLNALKITATTAPMGAGKWRECFNRYLSGKDIVILPDNDKPGRDHAHKIAHALHGSVKTIKVIDLPGLPEKGDVSDYILSFPSLDEAAERLSIIIENASPWKPEKKCTLDEFALNGTAQQMEKKMLDDKFILWKMALLGQSTIYYAKPNMGKTLIILALIIRAINEKTINPEDLFFINADDTHKGLVYKLKIAEKYGFKMLAPGYNDFKPAQLSEYLDVMITNDTARGKILILDTVKKFVDLMKKSQASEFGEVIRRFVSHGGSVIMLAHVNKHRDAEMKVVYSGTADLVDDCDCAYIGDFAGDEVNGYRMVRFENIKCRGDVARETCFRYLIKEGTPYYDKLESVEPVDVDAAKDLQMQTAAFENYKANKPIIDSIIDCIREGTTQKTALILEVIARTRASKRRIGAVLADYTGSNHSDFQFWTVTIGEKNSHSYELNHGTFTEKLRGG